MYQIDNDSAVVALPSRPAPGVEKFYTNGNPGTGQRPTIVEDWWLNMMQAEVRNVVVAAGITPDKGNDAQLLAAINVLAGGSPSTSAANKGYMNRYCPLYQSATVVRIPAGAQYVKKDGTFEINFTSNADITMTNSGVNGLDTGAVANSTPYFFHAIDDSTGTNPPAGIVSLSYSSPALPSGYDRFIPLNLMVPTNGSGNLLAFDILQGWPNIHLVRWRVVAAANAYPTNMSIHPTILAYQFKLGLGYDNQVVSCAPFQPYQISDMAFINMAMDQSATATSWFAWGPGNGTISAVPVVSDDINQIVQGASNNTVDWKDGIGKVDPSNGNIRLAAAGTGSSVMNVAHLGYVVNKGI